MEHNQKILEFANVNITEYLNKIHVTDDMFLIEQEKHNISQCKKELNTHLRLSFIENCDALLSILQTYNFCFSLVQKCHVPKPVQEEDTRRRGVCKELKSVLRHFEEDMSPFVTDSRYLVCAEAFGDLFVVLANDLLFIGRKKEGKSRYELEHSFSRGVVSMRTSDNGTRGEIVATSGARYEIEGEHVQALHDAFQQLTCDFEEEYRGRKREAVRDADLLVEYYVATEQMEKLVEYVGSRNGGAAEAGRYDARLFRGFQFRFPDELRTAMGLCSAPTSLLDGYVMERFVKGLRKVNRLEASPVLIEKAFGYLEEFLAELEEFYDKTEVPRSHFLICAEQLILRVFLHLERRIFNKFHRIEENDRNIEIVKRRLRLNGLDFGYLIRRLLEKRDDFMRACIEAAKGEIAARVDGMFG